MKGIEILSALEGLGWRCDKDEVGDYFCLMDIGKVQIQIIPTIGKRSDHLRASLMSPVSTKSFMVAAAFVLDGISNYVPITVSNYVSEKIINLSLDDVVRLSQNAISWASTQGIGKDLAVYRALPTDSEDAMPLRYLAVLAMAGDVSHPANYQFSFEQGDRLGFISYVIQNMIERAPLIARGVR